MGLSNSYTSITFSGIFPNDQENNGISHFWSTVQLLECKDVSFGSSSRVVSGYRFLRTNVYTVSSVCMSLGLQRSKFAGFICLFLNEI